MSTPAIGGTPRLIGASVPRREDPRLLRGHGCYVDDVVLPGMVHAAFVRSPLARASIADIDTSAAREINGVVGVWTAADGLPPMPPSWVHSPVALPACGLLADGDVRFVGDPVAVVLAESRYLAEDGRDLVRVEYEPLEPIIDYEQAADEAERVHLDLEGNVAWAGASPEDHELARAFAAADHVFTETFRQQRATSVPMETRGLVASWDPGTEQLTVWLSTQHPHQDRTMLASLMDVPEHDVRVIMRDVGGAFGQKAFHGRDEFCVAYLSRRVGRPIKWIEDRQENLVAATHARHELMTVSLAVAGDGRLLAARVDYLGDAGAYPLVPPHIVPALATRTFPGPYRIPLYGWSARAVYTNTCGLGPYRGPWMMETTAREMMLDVVARELALDPVELRRRNVLGEEELPYQTPTGMTYEAIAPAATLDQALELGDHAGIRERQRRARREGRLVGVGVSCVVEPTAMGGHGPSGVEAAIVRVEPSGHVTLLMGTGSHGHSLETTMPQVVAEHLGVPIEHVVLRQGDTSAAPFGGGTGASRSAVLAGNAARASALAAREKALAIAAHRLEAAVEDLELRDGVVSVRGSEWQRITVEEIARIAYEEPGLLPAGMEPGLETIARFAAPAAATHSNATHLCVCEVDPRTGKVELLDYVVSEDCGVMINPMVVEGQIAGGVVQGIGGALLEHLRYDADGRPLVRDLRRYLIPTTCDVPSLRFGHIETPSLTPGGHKGMAEGGAIAAVAAVANAVADALAPGGARVTELPLSPDRVLHLIREGRSQRACGSAKQ